MKVGDEFKARFPSIFNPWPGGTFTLFDIGRKYYWLADDRGRFTGYYTRPALVVLFKRVTK